MGAFDIRAYVHKAIEKNNLVLHKEDETHNFTTFVLSLAKHQQMTGALSLAGLDNMPVATQKDVIDQRVANLLFGLNEYLKKVEGK